ncbi:MAG TPA: PspC domain-containing protein [Candidatus Dojkabacteria bacterium]|nr:PspC domain-containing protein [Candidatus Dojkabacteria bacterium]HQF36986.1 PspC domain-containing protein [Candidatus Dojkabacteria bacterium]
MEEIKKLYRLKSDQMIGGVASGIAKYLSMDPTVIRLPFVLISVFGGSGLMLYLVLLIIIPLEP